LRTKRGGRASSTCDENIQGLWPRKFQRRKVKRTKEPGGKGRGCLLKQMVARPRRIQKKDLSDQLIKVKWGD